MTTNASTGVQSHVKSFALNESITKDKKTSLFDDMLLSDCDDIKGRETVVVNNHE